MSIKKKKSVRIGIYYDGYYFYKVSNFYKFDHPRQARISISGLHNYISSEISAKQNVDVDSCKVVEAHYFRGRSSKVGNEKAIIGERYFEDALTREGVNLHYLPLIRGINNELKEKGIDVSLALDAYKKAAASTFDLVVLIAGDGDYLPLVRELQVMADTPVDVMLISWDFECSNGDVTMTSQDLLEEVKYPVQMANVIDDRLNIKNPLVSGLFEPKLPESLNLAIDSQTSMQHASQSTMQAVSENRPIPTEDSAYQMMHEPMLFVSSPQVQSYSSSPGIKRKVLTDTQMAQERISTILSLNGSGGWIRDMEYNNFYFFYSDVVNKKPEELSPGMTLQFRLKFDRIKTEQKDNGEPSYRAIGPIYAVE